MFSMDVQKSIFLKTGLMVTGETTAWLGVNNEAKELFGSGSSGGGSMVPTWLITTTQTWTVPVTGNYRLTCIGKGGDGGDGRCGNNNMYNTRYYYYLFPSTGGGGGAVAIADRKLDAGTTLTCNVTGSNTNINTTALKATAGANGVAGELLDHYHNDNPTITSKTYSAAPGGIASGEWMTYGYNGNAGNYPVNTVSYEDYYCGYRGDFVKTPSYYGGNVGCIIFSPAINGNSGLGAFPGSCVDGVRGYAYTFTGSGSHTVADIPEEYFTTVANGAHPGGGGTGAQCAFYPYDLESGYSSEKELNATGGKGGIGAIVIQFLG